MTLSSTIVVAEVTGVYDAEDIVVPVGGLENDEHRVPNQRIGFQVSNVLTGDISESFDLFHTGDADFVLAGDPPYEIGQNYLLFLSPREDGGYLVVSPEGRFEVTKKGLEPMSEKAFAQILRGVKVREVVRDLGQMVGGHTLQK